MDKKWVYVLAGVGIGVVFAGQIRQLPIVNKLPNL